VPVEGLDESLPIISVGSESVILVGLGNTGEKLRLTRHNAGHLVLDALALEQDMTWQQTSAGEMAEGLIQDIPILLVKPDTAINHSGDAIRRMLGADALLRAVVVHDDMDLELGAVKVRRGGGDGGHLGVRSIITVSQTQDFQRIRLGVRPPGDDRKTVRLVHDSFSGQELQQLSTAFALGLRQLLD
jgi:PTH1 family peptidyl-tRNA hydrolase